MPTTCQRGHPLTKGPCVPCKRLRQQRYSQTAKGQATLKKYNAGPKRQALQAAYERTDAGRATMNRYRATPAGQAMQDGIRERQHLWNHSPSLKASVHTALPLPDARRVVVLSDFQLPFEDPAATELALRFAKDYAPDTLILNGDITDCYQFSDFDRDPRKGDTLTSEAYKSRKLLARLGWAPRLVWLGGNHEDRWARQFRRMALTSTGPRLEVHRAMMLLSGTDATMEDAAFCRLMGLHTARPASDPVIYRPYGWHADLAHDHLIVTHGFLASSQSAFSAKRTYERLGVSCLIGHTHRLGNYMVSNLRGMQGGWENGCLCELEPSYAQFPNWQQGFSVVEIFGDAFHVTQIPILRSAMTRPAADGPWHADYSLRFQGQEWALKRQDVVPLGAKDVTGQVDAAEQARALAPPATEPRLDA